MLEAHAGIARQRNGGELAALLHQGEHLSHAERHLHDMLQHLLAEAAEAGDLRGDVPPAELTQYCLHALTAAAALTSQSAVARLVAVTLDGLRPVP
ncbi:SbtR family transcriptional regulator [Streptomyces sp. NPDC054838]